MTAQLLDGKAVAQTNLLALKTCIEAGLDRGERAPSLAVVLVGSDPASQVYVKNKRQRCASIGLNSLAYDLPEACSETDLLRLIHRLNRDPLVDGILVQLPLPSHINEQTMIEAIDPKKDVDGFHPYNLGRLVTQHPILRPCTPMGIMTLLAHYQIPIQGKKVVIVGSSNIVGRPQTLEMLMAKATVTVCHSATQAIEHEIAQADILIVAIGKPRFIQGDWIKPGAVVIDVGINRLPSGQLCGDVDFDAARLKASYITPVPGGIGPMTVYSLLQNTMLAAKLNHPMEPLPCQ